MAQRRRHWVVPDGASMAHRGRRLRSGSPQPTLRGLKHCTRDQTIQFCKPDLQPPGRQRPNLSLELRVTAALVCGRLKSMLADGIL